MEKFPHMYTTNNNDKLHGLACNVEVQLYSVEVSVYNYIKRKYPSSN